LQISTGSKIDMSLQNI